MKRVDGRPYAQADAFGHLCEVDHAVSQEYEHRALLRVCLPITSEGSGPTDRSHAAAPHEVGFVGLQHNLDTQAESSTRGPAQTKPSGVSAHAACDLIGVHQGERFRSQKAYTIHTAVSKEEPGKFQVVVDGGP